MLFIIRYAQFNPTYNVHYFIKENQKSSKKVALFFYASEDIKNIFLFFSATFHSKAITHLRYLILKSLYSYNSK